MPSNTPNFALPYPLPADPADVPSDIQALAMALDTLLNSGRGFGKAPTRTVLATAGSGTYNTPAGCRALLVECIGAGGGTPALSINPTNAGVGGGGGGGAYAASVIPTPAASYPYTVPTNGPATANAKAGASIFGANLVVADGGSAGSAVATAGFNNVGGALGGQAAACVGQIVLPGSDGGIALVISPTQVTPPYGGAAARGGGGTAPTGGNANRPGTQGKDPGGGAGGSWVITSGTVAGAGGGKGLIVVTELY